MQRLIFNSATLTLGLVIIIALVLSGCGGNFQAPVAEQGERHALALVMRRVWPERHELRAHVTRTVSVSPDEVADAYGETLREIAGQLSDDELRLLTNAARVMREGSARLRAAKEDSGAEDGG